MQVYVYESSYFGLFEVWADIAKLKDFIEDNSDCTVQPYGEGWNVYIPERHSPVAVIRPHLVR